MLFTASRPSRRSSPSGDEATRVRLAARPETPAGTLRILADDPAVTVRAAVAMNPAYAPAATCRLVADEDERVRALLGDKIARLLPGLTGQEHQAAQAHAHRTLLALAGDAAVRVRIAIAEALTAMPQAPRAVILRLANDPMVAVSEPILRLSPLLTDNDLLDLLASPAHSATAKAVASRAGLSAAIADTIAARADSAAVRALLQNASATIQEATLDSLIGRAGDHPEWHEPLVRRPSLPERAARALSRIVTGHVMQALISRSDLPGLMTLYSSYASHTPGFGPAEAASSWAAILAQPGLTVVVAEQNGLVAATCMLVVVPNLTWSGNPWAVIENVVTHPDLRTRGLGRRVLGFACERAWAAGCYKVSLATGSTQEATLRFYDGAGFTRGAKTLFEMRRPAG